MPPSRLPLLLALALLLPLIAADKDTPPPLPERDWVGKTALNYTLLHEKYGSSLFCSYTPLGVFGYYHRLGVCLSMLLSVNLGLQTEGLKGRFFPLVNWITSLPPLGFSYYLLVQNAKQLRNCPAYQVEKDGVGNSHIRALGYTGMVSASLFALGSTLLTVMLFKVKNKITFRLKSSVVGLLIVAAMIQFWMAKIYFIVVAASWKISFALESVRMDAAWCIYGPLAAFLVVAWVSYFWNLVMRCVRREGPDDESVGFCRTGQEVVMGAGFVALSVFNAIATVKLGNVVGDPFGKYTLDEPEGLADAVLLGTIPVFQLGMIFLSKSLGRFETEPQEHKDGNSKITVTYASGNV